MNKTPDFDAAAGFLAANARVLDRRVFQRLFSGGAAGPVRDAVAAYRNADGGFGHALEPDLRTAGSQPAAVEMALRIMDLAGDLRFWLDENVAAVAYAARRDFYVFGGCATAFLASSISRTRSNARAARRTSGGISLAGIGGGKTMARFTAAV